jgi:hypothetical protein
MDTHGYVYAFAHQSKGWVKIGMTEKDDPERCWARIGHYIKQHRLPDTGWDFVGFIATYKARELETKLHRSLKRFRVTLDGDRTELFQCSVSVYFAALEQHGDFIDGTQSRYGHAAPKETDEQRIEREASYIRSEQRRIRKAIDDEWTVNGYPPSRHNKIQREREFWERWEEHPVQKERRAKEEAERAERQRRDAEQQRREAVERAERQRHEERATPPD